MAQFDTSGLALVDEDADALDASGLTLVEDSPMELDTSGLVAIEPPPAAQAEDKGGVRDALTSAATVATESNASRRRRSLAEFDEIDRKESAGETSFTDRLFYSNDTVRIYAGAPPERRKELRQEIETSLRDDPTETAEDFVAGAGVLGEALLETPEQVLGSFARSIRGGDVELKPEQKGWMDSIINQAAESAENFAAEGASADKDREFLFGITQKDIRELPQNMGFSFASMAYGITAGVGAAAATAATGVGGPAAPVAGWTAGTTASGVAAFRMSKDQFVEDLRDFLNKQSQQNRGRGLTSEEWEGLRDKYNGAANRFGLWEAVPEALSNAAGLGIIRAPIKALMASSLMKSMLVRATVKFAGIQAAEHATELVTGIGQEGILKETGQIEKERSAWQIAKDQAAQVALLTTVMGIGAAGVSKAYDATAGRVDPLNPSRIDTTVQKLESDYNDMLARDLLDPTPDTVPAIPHRDRPQLDTGPSPTLDVGDAAAIEASPLDTDLVTEGAKLGAPDAPALPSVGSEVVVGLEGGERRGVVAEGGKIAITMDDGQVIEREAGFLESLGATISPAAPISVPIRDEAPALAPTEPATAPSAAETPAADLAEPAAPESPVAPVSTPQDDVPAVEAQAPIEKPAQGSPEQAEQMVTDFAPLLPKFKKTELVSAAKKFEELGVLAENSSEGTKAKIAKALEDMLVGGARTSPEFVDWITGIIETTPSDRVVGGVGSTPRGISFASLKLNAEKIAAVLPRIALKTEAEQVADQLAMEADEAAKIDQVAKRDISQRSATVKDLIRLMGGIKPSDETRARDLHKVWRGIVRESGRPIGEIRERLEEEGHIPPQSSDSEAWRMIDQDLAGGMADTKVGADAATREETTAQAVQAQQYADAAREVADVVKSLGLEVTAADVEAATRDVVENGADPMDAIIQANMDRVDETLETVSDIKEGLQDDDIPFDTGDQAQSQEGEAGGAVSREAPPGPVPEPSEATTEVVAEPEKTGEGEEFLDKEIEDVLELEDQDAPPARREDQQTEMKARQAGPLRSAAEQKADDIGLFGTPEAVAQSDEPGLDLTPAEPTPEPTTPIDTDEDLTPNQIVSRGWMSGDPDANPYLSSSNNSDAFALGVFLKQQGKGPPKKSRHSRGYTWIADGHKYAVDGRDVTDLGPVEQSAAEEALSKLESTATEVAAIDAGPDLAITNPEGEIGTEVEDPATEPPETTLQRAGLTVERDETKTGKTVWRVTGKGTFDNKDVLKDLGAKWFRPKKAWSIFGDENPTGRIAAAIGPGTGGEGTADGSGAGGRTDHYIHIRELREREDGIADNRRTGEHASSQVSERVQGLIRKGLEFGIPEIVVEEQIEDIGMITGAFKDDKPIFILANDAGTGKTFVLGGAMAELRDAGAEKFIYVTMNTDLIDQVQKDLAAYGVDDVEFITYSAMSKGGGVDATDAVLIFDETQNIKNALSARGAVGQGLMSQARFTIFASATPFENPTQAEYLKGTGLFEGTEGFATWAEMYGATVSRHKDGEVRWIRWPGDKKADAVAAREWFFKQGIMTQRGMRIPADMVDTEFHRNDVDPKWLGIYNDIEAVYEDAMSVWQDENGNSLDPTVTAMISMHRVNTVKRVLEASKAQAGIDRAKDWLSRTNENGDPYNVVIFVETKADREIGRYRMSGAKQSDPKYSYPEIAEMMAEWKMEADMAKAMDERPPRRPFSEAIVEIARAMNDHNVHFELPSVADDIIAQLGGKDEVGVYTGAVTAASAKKSKADFLAGRKRVLIATMAKGGTGLSLHDTVGNRPTVQVNINLPWVATGVAQVSGRVARYGIQSRAQIEWLFASNISFEGKLAARVGGRMQDMGAVVKGIEVKAAEVLAGDFDFEGATNVGQVEGAGKIDIAALADDIYAEAERLERTRRKAKDTAGGFFETPFPLAALITKISGMKAGDNVLEPSAGTGNLIRFAPDGTNVTAVERRTDNWNKLKVRHPDAVHGDFLEWAETSQVPFDTIVMNPPFERLKGIGPQDAAHVRKAYDLLRSDGRLVAIMGEGVFFREAKPDVAFREWLNEVGATVIELPADTFKGSGTGVKARMVVIDRDGTGGRIDMHLADLEADSLREIEREVPIRERGRRQSRGIIPRAEFITKFNTIAGELEAQLSKLNLGDKIRVEIVNRIAGDGIINGDYGDAVIRLALGTAQNEVRTLNHEVIHAMRDLGLFSDKEWAALEANARASKARMAWVKLKYRGDGLTEQALVEEVIGDQFADRYFSPPKGQIARLYRRVADVIMAVARAFRAAEYESAEQVFRDIENGTVGAREVSRADMAVQTARRQSRTRRPINIVLPGGETFIDPTAKSPQSRPAQPKARRDTRVQEPLDVDADARAAAVESLGRVGGTAEIEQPVRIPPLRERQADRDADPQFQMGGVLPPARGPMPGPVGGQFVPPGPAQGGFGPPFGGGPVPPSPAAPGGRGPGGRGPGLFTASFTGPAKSLEQAMERAAYGRIAHLRAGAGYLADAARERAQDKSIWLKRTQEGIARARGHAIDETQDAYLYQTLFHGRTGELLEDLTRNVVEPIIKKIRTMDLTVEQVDDYLYARHAKERNAKIKLVDPTTDEGSGMSDATADDILAGRPYEVEPGQPLAPGLTADELTNLKNVAVDVDAMIAAAIQTRLDAGLIDRATAQAWATQYQHYAPLRGFADETLGADIAEGKHAGAGTGAGFNVRGPESRQALGRRSRADSPFAHVIMQAESAIVRAEKNTVDKALARLVQANPNPEFWEFDKIEYIKHVNKTTGLMEFIPDPAALRADNVLFLKIDGKPHRITMHHPGLAQAFTNAGADVSNWMTRGLQATNRWLAFVNTALNPEFILTNLARDVQTGAINLQGADLPTLATNTMRDLPKALIGAYGGIKGKSGTEWQNYYHEYARAGGKTNFFALDGLEKKKKRLHGMVKDIDPSNARKMFLAAKAAEQLVLDANSAVENAVRLSAFANARRLGVSEREAARLAKELTVNFNRKGTAGALIGSAYLFYNASLQGSMRMITALKHKKVRRVVAGIVAASFVMDFVNSALAPDPEDGGEDEWDRISPWTKEHNLILMNPLAEPGGPAEDAVLFKFPMPYGYNVFAILGLKAGAVARGKIDPMTAAADIVVAAMSAFNPIGGGHDLLSTITPTIFTPVQETGTNKNFMGTPIYPDKNPYGAPIPDSQRYFSSATKISKGVAQTLNDLTGGDEIFSGGVDVSPETLDHYFQFLTGGAGTFVSRSVDFGAKVLTGEEVTWDEVPIARRFIGGKNLYYDRAKYREIKDAVEVVDRARKAWANDPEAIAELRREHGPELRMRGVIKNSEKVIRRLYRARKRLIKAGASDERIEDINDRITEIMSRANAIYAKKVN